MDSQKLCMPFNYEDNNDSEFNLFLFKQSIPLFPNIYETAQNVLYCYQTT